MNTLTASSGGLSLAAAPADVDGNDISVVVENDATVTGASVSADGDTITFTSSLTSASYSMGTLVVSEIKANQTPHLALQLIQG